MSDLISRDDPCLKNENCEQPEDSPINRILPIRSKDLGGFQVRRVLPYAKQRMIGPWIFFDHMGPVDFPPGEGIDVRPHPHINLATVTYLFEGEIWHRDSLGNSEPIKPGDINLMVAGRGIVHSERTRKELMESGQKLHGLQLWLALPESDEETEPDFIHYDKSEIPSIEVGGVPVRVMIGEAYGIESPVKTFAQTLYLEARLKAGQEIELPFSPERGIYVASGSVIIGDENLSEYQMAVLNEGASVKLKATKDSFVALIGGEKLSERKMLWNFVSSRQERIDQAKDDWISGKFPKVFGDEKDFIPFPEV